MIYFHQEHITPTVASASNSSLEVVIPEPSPQTVTLIDPVTKDEQVISVEMENIISIFKSVGYVEKVG